MIVPYEIAVKLKQLGFSKPTLYYYESNGEIEQSFFIDNECKVTVDDLLFDFNNDNWWGYPSDSISAPTVSDALQDIRERYRVICAVDVDYFDGWYYTGKYLFMGETEFKYTESFDDHPEAELSLLKQVVEYLRKKK